MYNGQKFYRTNIENLDTMLEEATTKTLREMVAIFNLASLRAYEFVFMQILPMVALKSGKLRAGFIDALEKNIEVQISTKYLRCELKWNMTRLIDSVFDAETMEYYAAEHIKQHPTSRWPGGQYFKPSEPGTKPIDLEFWSRVKNLMGNEILRNLALWGYNVT